MSAHPPSVRAVPERGLCTLPDLHPAGALPDRSAAPGVPGRSARKQRACPFGPVSRVLTIRIVDASGGTWEGTGEDVACAVRDLRASSAEASRIFPQLRQPSSVLPQAVACP